jgi:hypothetical protein
MTETRKGACLCGEFSYEFGADQVLSINHCHCTDCQKSTGGGKATIVMVNTEGLKTRGELKTYTVEGTDGGHVTRGFCPNCGSQVLGYVEEVPVMRFVKAGTLADSSWVKVDSSFWSSSAQPWSPVDSELPACDNNPNM